MDVTEIRKYITEQLDNAIDTLQELGRTDREIFENRHVANLLTIDDMLEKLESKWISVEDKQKPKPMYNGMSDDILIKCKQKYRDKYFVGYYDNVSEKFDNVIEWRYIYEERQNR